MKAITLWQPWASLIACGAKRYETHGFKTNYRGLIAIHAGLKDGADVMTSDQIIAIMRAFTGTRYEVPHERGSGGYDYIYPYGAVVATAELVGCYLIEKSLNRKPVIIKPEGEDWVQQAPIGDDEFLFGDWTPGRYAWELVNVQMLTDPIPAKGKRGLWNLEVEL